MNQFNLKHKTHTYLHTNNHTKFTNLQADSLESVCRQREANKVVILLIIMLSNIMILYKEKQKQVVKVKANSRDHRININGYFTQTHMHTPTQTKKHTHTCNNNVVTKNVIETKRKKDKVICKINLKNTHFTKQRGEFVESAVSFFKIFLKTSFSTVCITFFCD